MLPRIITLTAVAALGVSSAALARGGGGMSGGGHFGHMGHFGHQFPRNPLFINPFLRNQVLRNLVLRNQFLGNQAFLGGWGSDWGWGPYGDTGYGSNTTVVVFPQAVPQTATGSTSSGPCHWNRETFTVPSSQGGTRSVQVVSCRSGQLASEPEGASSNK